ELEKRDIPFYVINIVSLFVFMLVNAAWSKQIILRNVPTQLEFYPAGVEDFPRLDVESVEYYSRALEELGFVPFQEFTLKSDVQNFSTGYARQFLHPRHQVVAEVNQVFPPPNTSMKPTKVRCVLLSLLEDNWYLGTTNREPSSYTYMLRRPRGVGTTHPGATPAELLQIHLEKPTQMMDDLGIKVITGLTPQAYFEHETRATVERREILQKRNGLVNWLQAWWFDLNPKKAWMGDYGASGRASQIW